MITIKSQRELDKMKKAGDVVMQVHDAIRDEIAPGVTTGELNRIALEVIQRNHAIPSFLGVPSPYGGMDFPAAICASVNEEVIHGLPGDRVLKEGDIVSVDIGAILDGWHGDAARTYPVGSISKEADTLLNVTRQSFEAGIQAAIPGNRIRDISAAVQKVVEAHGCAVVRDFVGHGIGTGMHEAPQIPNFSGKEKGPRLVEGMTLAVEPMVNLGTWKIQVLSDKWTIVTADGSLSAHHENTFAVTANGPLILTKRW